MKNIPCRKVRGKISAYMDGELDSGLSRTIEQHIGRCAACRKMVSDFRGVDALVRGLQEIETEAEFAGEFLERTDEGACLTARPHPDRQAFSWVLQFTSNLMGMLKERTSPNTHSLDEFGDFPPCSIGSVYLKLLDRPIGG